MRMLGPAIAVFLAACAAQPPASTDNLLAASSYAAGMGLRNKGEHESAIREFDQAIRLNPGDIEAYIDRGQSRRDRGEYDLAFADFDAAIRIDPSSARAHVNRGYTRYVMREFDRAIASYDEAIRLGLIGAHYERASAWFDKGERERAVADFSVALRNDRAHVLDYLGRVKASDRPTDRERTLAGFGEAIRLAPQAPDGYYGRGSAWYTWRDYSRALADFAEVIRLDPRHLGAHAGTAWLLSTAPDATIRDGKRAVGFARRACELSDWQSPYAMQTLAIAYAEANDYAEAVRWMEEAFKFPDFARDAGAGAHERLALFRSGKPYREDAP